MVVKMHYQKEWQVNNMKLSSHEGKERSKTLSWMHAFSVHNVTDGTKFDRAIKSEMTGVIII
jgi:hypothetical protein